MTKPALPEVGIKVAEYERRFLVKRIDPSTFSCPKRQIVQGYLDTADRRHGLRIRVIDSGRQAILTMKHGHGQIRQETNQECSVETAYFLLQTTDEIIRKIRHFRDGWEIDCFRDELDGLVLAELETASPDMETVLPPWILEAVEVTDHISNRDLAKLVKFLKGMPPVPNLADLILNRRPRIVLTGGPCSGKSVMMKAFAEEFGEQVHCLPETATIVISLVGCRPPVGDPIGMGFFQETVYQTQRGFETAANIQACRDGKKAVLLDRGTIDNVAYLENGWEDLERLGKTTKAHEMRQYDLVLCLEAPPREVFEREKSNNPARSETYEQAEALGRATETAWRDHPGFVFIPNSSSWETKIRQAREAIGHFLNGLA